MLLDLSTPPPESSIVIRDFGVWGKFLEKSTWRYTTRGCALLASTALPTAVESNEPPVDSEGLLLLCETLVTQAEFDQTRHAGTGGTSPHPHSEDDAPSVGVGLEDDIDLEPDLGPEHTPPASSCDESEDDDDTLLHVQDARTFDEDEESQHGGAGNAVVDHTGDSDGDSDGCDSDDAAEGEVSRPLLLTPPIHRPI